MAAQMMCLTLELKAITDLLSELLQQLREDALFSAKIRASAESVHNHFVLAGSPNYFTSVT